MANIQSAKKRIRQTMRRTAVNRDRLVRIRTFLRYTEEAIANGKKKEAQEAFKTVQPELVRGVKTGLFHRNTVTTSTLKILLFSLRHAETT